MEAEDKMARVSAFAVDEKERVGTGKINGEG